SAAKRIERGIAILAEGSQALDAFRLANRAVARALKKRLAIETPQWRAFQLAFILLNLPSLATLSDPEREIVDLLFFPTGGGKTEAYLGLAAFAMVLRRLRNPGEQGLAGAGVSVVMRYTLRLLTLDQLGRAAGLVCALELERERDQARYGGGARGHSRSACGWGKPRHPIFSAAGETIAPTPRVPKCGNTRPIQKESLH